MKFILFLIKISVISFILTINAYSNEKIVYVDMNTLINNSKAGTSINNQMKKILDKKLAEDMTQYYKEDLKILGYYE